MLELRLHIKSLTRNVGGECRCLARCELAVAQAVRDLAVAMFGSNVAIIWDDSTLSYGQINKSTEVDNEKTL